jgi:soluble lytic murein transglycosylase
MNNYNKKKFHHLNKNILPFAAVSLLFSTYVNATTHMLSNADKFSHQRTLYVAAEQALTKGSLDKYQTYKKQLKNYPLYPYLAYTEMVQNFDRVSAYSVDSYLKNYSDIPISNRLRSKWLNYLAKKERWKEYIRFYIPTSQAKKQCHYLQALINTGKSRKALKQVTSVWLSGDSRPDACDPVFKAWRNAGHMTESLVWQRIEMAINKRHSKLARYLSKFLPKKQKLTVDLWRKVMRDPGIILSQRKFKKDDERTQKILAYGIARLASKDAIKALSAWDSIQPSYPFTEQQKNHISRQIGLKLARQNHPTALKFLSSMPTQAKNLKVQETGIRVALKSNNWEAVLDWVNKLPKTEQENENWQYWKARALIHGKKPGKADKILTQLAKSRSYYGFLAADKLGVNYHLANIPFNVSQSALDSLWKIPALSRAHEFHALNRLTEARREWREATKDFDEYNLKVAARLARNWGWHDRAIFTLSRAKYWDDLSTRFPLAHKNFVTEGAHKQDIEPAWVYAVVRQESAFIADAYSSAGAMGLMQLMPRTAKQVARQQKHRLKNTAELLNAQTNIKLGTAYLRSVMNKLDNHTVLATAAYNAGPHRVKQWLPEGTSIPADIWVETIPFNETRKYLRRVLSYTVIYEQRLGFPQTTLRERMRPIRMLDVMLSQNN